MDFRALAEATENRYRPKSRCSSVRVEKVIRVVRKESSSQPPQQQK